MAERRDAREREERRRLMAEECNAARQAQMALKAKQVVAEKEMDAKLMAATTKAAAEAAAAADRVAAEAEAKRRANAEDVKWQREELQRRREEEKAMVYKERQELMLAEARRARRIAAHRSMYKDRLSKEGVDDTAQARTKI